MLAVVITILTCMSLFNSRNLNLHINMRTAAVMSHSDNNLLWSTSPLSATTTTTTTTKTLPIMKQPRVLMGIFSADMVGDARYRQAFRKLLNVHPKVCNYNEYKRNPQQYTNCELLYTFVLGGNPNGLTEFVKHHDNMTILTTEVPRVWFSPDVNETDMTFLNIK